MDNKRTIGRVDPSLENEPTIDGSQSPTAVVPPGFSASHSQPRSAGTGFAAGDLAGDYRLVGALGSGGFGEVWEAEELGSGRRVALKLLARAQNAPEETRERFRREAMLAAGLNHPRCVYVLGTAEIAGVPAIAMELVPGGTLQDLLKRHGALPYRQAVDHVLDLLEGLEAAHAAGILHRDIKPSNCFLDAGGRVRLGDFGLSRTLDTEPSLTVTGSFLGTPTYSSPEQVRGRTLDIRSDFYALGATAYALLSGKPPLVAEQLGETMAKILTETPPPISTHGMRVPRGLERVIQRLLAKEPAKRFQDHASLRRALEPFSSVATSAGELPVRAGAYAVDMLLLSVVTWTVYGLLAMQAAPTDIAGWRVRDVTTEVVLRSIWFFYLFLLAGFAGGSVGKRLFGLRVTAAEGGRAGWKSLAVRTGVFLGIPAISDVAIHVVYWNDLVFWRNMHQAEDGGAMFYAAIHLIVTFSLLATMRRRNGYAGIHELASGTRVRRVDVLRERSQLRPPALAPAAPASAAAGSYGPFRVVAALHEGEGESLLVCSDDALRRQVWVRVRSVAEAESAAPASGRGLRWLQSGREHGVAWEAYEHPGGASLGAWVRESAGLGWGETRGILAGAAAVVAASREQLAQESIGIDRLWVDGAGQVRLLPFAAERTGAVAHPAAEWQRFLWEVLAFSATGTVPGAAGAKPLPPLPEHGRTIAERLAAGGYGSPQEVAVDLAANARRPAAVGRRRRTAALLLPLVVPLLFAGFSAWFVGKLVAAAPVIGAPKAGKALQAELEKQGPVSQPDARRRQLRLALAADVTALETMPAGFGQGALRSFPELLRQEADAGRADLATATPAEIAAARAVAQQGMKAEGPPAPAVLLVGVLYIFLSFGALAAIPLAVALRNGGALSMFGLAVQCSDGARAGRLRVGARALVAWGPLLMMLPFLPWDLDVDEPAGAVVAAVVALGFLYSLLRPERGIPDLVAGTRIAVR